MPEEEGITNPKGPSNLTYKKSGVEIDAGAALIEAVKPLARATARPGAAAELGGFGALFDLKEAGYRDPILVASTDGVGTKLKVAIAAGRHDWVGIDLVAMCVNDLVVQGAEPLFFLDYYATGKLDVEAGKSLLAGIAEGCRRAGCALIGGETAAAGDVILGLASSGLHANGFSLVRRVIEDGGLDYAGPAPFDHRRSLADALLEPTRIYVKGCLAALGAGGVRAFAHITGGGLAGNIPRVLPEGLAAEIDATAWPLPAVFTWLAGAGGIAPAEMGRTFNCGIGMVMVADPDRAGDLERVLTEAGETVTRVGRITRRKGPAVVLGGMENAWHG